jgi:hypothetical protein
MHNLHIMVLNILLVIKLDLFIVRDDVCSVGMTLAILGD